MPMTVLPAEAVQGYTAGRLPGMGYTSMSFATPHGMLTTVIGMRLHFQV